MLIEQIRADLTTAMKARDALRTRTLRAVIAAVQEAEVAGESATTLDDAGVQKVIQAQAKRRIEAAEAFEQGGRAEKAADERAELEVLEGYLPAALGADELDALVDKVLAAEGFSSKADMGKAMKAVNAVVAGRADGRAVADLVKSKLG
ncbi:MAG: GatB/YqeY domain-containing protein [Acidimicrobiales bacterium]